MSLICGAPKFSIWDMKNFKARPIELFGHLWCSETVSGPYFSRWNWTFTSPVEIEILNDQPTDKRSFLGGNQKRLRFFTPQRGRIGSFGSNIFSSASPKIYPNPHKTSRNERNRQFSNKEPHISFYADLTNRFKFSWFSRIFGIWPPRWVVGLG